jgi:protein translocase SecG subunit
MISFLMFLFIVLCFVLAFFVLLQQGKGDLGLGGLMGNQQLFGGSGGQQFFERATWIMIAIFVSGALGLTILKTRSTQVSSIVGYKETKPVQAPLPSSEPVTEK